MVAGSDPVSSQSATIGAENSAPPGMGSRPMMAGNMAMDTCRLVLERTATTRSRMVPLSAMVELNQITRRITSMSMMLSRLTALRREISAMERIDCPDHIANTTAISIPAHRIPHPEWLRIRRDATMTMRVCRS